MKEGRTVKVEGSGESVELFLLRAYIDRKLMTLPEPFPCPVNIFRAEARIF